MDRFELLLWVWQQAQTTPSFQGLTRPAYIAAVAIGFGVAVNTIVKLMQILRPPEEKSRNGWRGRMEVLTQKQDETVARIAQTQIQIEKLLEEITRAGTRRDEMLSKLITTQDSMISAQRALATTLEASTNTLQTVLASFQAYSESGRKAMGKIAEIYEWTQHQPRQRGSGT